MTDLCFMYDFIESSILVTYFLVLSKSSANGVPLTRFVPFLGSTGAGEPGKCQEQSDDVLHVFRMSVIWVSFFVGSVTCSGHLLCLVGATGSELGQSRNKKTHRWSATSTTFASQHRRWTRRDYTTPLHHHLMRRAPPVKHQVNKLNIAPRARKECKAFYRVSFYFS